MEPPAAAVRAAPYSAIEIRMYAATLPEPDLSSQPFWPPKLSSSAAGRTSVKMMVRRLRSIRLSSMPSTVRLKPPSGRDPADGSGRWSGWSCRDSLVGCVVVGGVVVVAGEAEERVLEAAGGDLEVVRGGLVSRCRATASVSLAWM